MIRPVNDGDVPAITELYAHYVENTTATWMLTAPDQEQWREKIAGIHAAGLPFLVLEEDGQIAGFAYLAPYRDRGGWVHTAEDTIYLRESATGRGHGRALLGALLDAADPETVREVVAMISGEVGGSVILHQRLGFREVGSLRGVGTKFGRSLDCVVMQRSLIL